MATCKECIHWDKCSKTDGRTRYYGERNAANNVEVLCEWFISSANVVEVVHCKDCINYAFVDGCDFFGKPMRYCVWHNKLKREDGYCDHGLRREIMGEKKW